MKNFPRFFFENALIINKHQEKKEAGKKRSHGFILLLAVADETFSVAV